MKTRRFWILAALGSLAGCYSTEMLGVPLANKKYDPRPPDAPIPMFQFVPSRPHILIGHVVGFGKKGIGFASAGGEGAEAEMRKWARAMGGDAIVGYGFADSLNFTAQGFVVKWEPGVFACLQCLTWRSDESGTGACAKCGRSRTACPYCQGKLLDPAGWCYCPKCRKSDLGAICMQCGKTAVCPLRCNLTVRKAECTKCKKEAAHVGDEDSCLWCAHPEWKPETFLSLDSGNWIFRCPHCAKRSEWNGQSGVLTCGECDKNVYLIRCAHCLQTNARKTLGQHACAHCGKSTAITMCKTCERLAPAAAFDGMHTCGSCRATYYAAACPSCKIGMVWDKYYERSTCVACKTAFDLPKPPRVEEGPAKGYFGLTIKDLPPEECKRLMVPEGEAVVVDELLEGSPAAGCGLRVGDVIVRIQDEAGERWNGTRASYLPWIQSKKPGTKIVLSVLRDEKTVKIEAVLAKLD